MNYLVLVLVLIAAKITLVVGASHHDSSHRAALKTDSQSKATGNLSSSSSSHVFPKVAFGAFEFTTTTTSGADAASGQTSNGLRRLRQADIIKNQDLPTASSQTKAIKKQDSISAITMKQDNKFWGRFLEEQVGSMPVTMPPTRMPIPMPTTTTTRMPTPTLIPMPMPMPTTPTTTPTPMPTLPSCPTIFVEVECILSDDASVTCTDLRPPDSGTGAECVASVEYLIFIENNGNEVETIYSITVTQGGVTTTLDVELPDILVTTVTLSPGEIGSLIFAAEIDLCGDLAFDFKADVLAGPPVEVETSIACVSEGGQECQSISEALTDDDCLLDVTYTYTVDNTGVVDANIVVFERTRDGDVRDLVPLLPDTFIPMGDTFQVQETEEIDRCVPQTFRTDTVVYQVPNPDLLCESSGYYP